MAEICSAYPTSGGLYYWSAKLAGKKWAPLASWVTGWYVDTAATKIISLDWPQAFMLNYELHDYKNKHLRKPNA
jgi:hypothetical protein